jgi:cobalt-zinc-cadmium efflux system protein
MPELHHGEEEAELRILEGMRLAVGLSFAILAIESVGAYLSHSLALTVDAVHNVPDILAFAISWAALRGTSSGSTSEFTYGTHRFEVFAGLLNGLLVLGTGAVFGYTAVVALGHGAPFAGAIDPTWVLVAAVPTLGLRFVSLHALGRFPGKVRDLNLRSVMVHLWSDVAITASLLVVGLTILLRPAAGWVDSAAALAIAGILVYESIPLLRGGWEVLTERTPSGLSVAAIAQSARAVPGVKAVHDVHVWAVCSSLVCLTAHVQVEEMSMRQGMQVVRELRERMESEFGIVHSTFEVEAT